MASMATSPSQARRNRRIVVAGAIAGLALAGFAPRNQRALFVTDGGSGGPQAYFLAPDSAMALGHPGIGGLPRSAFASPTMAHSIPLAAAVPPIVPPPAQPFALPVDPFAFTSRPVVPPGVPGILPAVLPSGGPPTLGPLPTVSPTGPGGPSTGPGTGSSSGGPTASSSSSGGTTILTPPSSVPEPSAWATMVGGLAVAGIAMRRAARRKPAAA